MKGCEEVDSLGRMITILLLAIFLLFVPLQLVAQSQAAIMEQIVENYTREFVDNIRQKGNITLTDYEEYLGKINQTGELYNIEFEHATPKTFGDLILDVQEDTRLASVNPSKLYTDLALDSEGATKAPIKIEVAPISLSIKKYETPAFYVTAYYDDETMETLSEADYTITGFDNTKIEEQTVTFSYTYNEVTVTCEITVIVTPMTTTCTICGHEYELDENDMDLGCPNCSSTIVKIEASPDMVTVNHGSALPITVYAIYKNGGRTIIDDWTSDYDPSKPGYQQVTITYNELKDYITVEVKALERICSICENAYSLNDDGSDPGCPICKITVVSIHAEPDPITIGLHQALDLEVTAIYQDGHTEVVNGWNTDLIPDKPGTFLVTVYYKTLTDQITVIVLDDDYITCDYCGDSYSRTRYHACPTCSITIVDIEARLRNGGLKVVKGTGLDLDIILIFKDTHREITNTGYTVSGYQPEMLGEQTVTIHYKEFQCDLPIEVIADFAKVTCPNGHEYNFNDDGSDPGCPYCFDGNDTDQKVVYYDITYTSTILETLYRHNVFEMKAGDYITITITKKSKAIGLLYRDFFRLGKKEKSPLTFGGEIIG